MQQNESKRSPESADVRHVMPTAEHGWKTKYLQVCEAPEKCFSVFED